MVMTEHLSAVAAFYYPTVSEWLHGVEILNGKTIII